VNEQGDSERERLRYFLDQQRQAVLAIIDGLDESQLRTPVLRRVGRPSGWCCTWPGRSRSGSNASPWGRNRT
jgi:hypothetical protein